MIAPNLPIFETKANQLAPCFLHLGLPKTATTMLQQYLFPSHSQIYYLGKTPGQRDRFPQEDAKRLNRYVFRKWPRIASTCKATMSQVRRRAAAQDRVMVWSDETPCRDHPTRHAQYAKSFRNVLGECKVIVMLRHPLDWLESMYFHKLEGFNRSQLEKQSLGRILGEQRCYFTIDEFLEASWELLGRGERCHFRYAEMIEQYSNVFGSDSIGFFLYEQMRDDPVEFIQSLCQFIGIDGGEAVRLVDGKRSNDRWTAEQFEKLQSIQQSDELLNKFIQGNRKTRWQELGLNSERVPGSTRARAEISETGKRQIREFTAAGNRRLVEQFQLPLEKYGYPL